METRLNGYLQEGLFIIITYIFITYPKTYIK